MPGDGIIAGRLLGLCGYKGSGKDSVHNAIYRMGINTYNHKFAEPLKRIAAAFLNECAPNVDQSLIHRDNGVAKQTREDVQEDLDEITGGAVRSVRQLLQFLGTEMGRQMNEDLWVRVLDRKIRMHAQVENCLNVITDCRFANEVEYVRQAGGAVVLVERPGLKPDGHASEDLPLDPSFRWDAVISNDGDRDQLADNVAEALEGLIESGKLRRPGKWTLQDWQGT